MCYRANQAKKNIAAQGRSLKRVLQVISIEKYIEKKSCIYQQNIFHGTVLAYPTPPHPPKSPNFRL